LAYSFLPLTNPQPLSFSQCSTGEGKSTGRADILEESVFEVENKSKASGRFKNLMDHRRGKRLIRALLGRGGAPQCCWVILHGLKIMQMQ
jgi:hypothetical protein